MSSYFIISTSRSLGLNLTRQLAALSSTELSKIFATIQKDAASLQELAFKSPNRIVSIKLDVTSEISIKHAVSQLENEAYWKGLNILINDAEISKHALKQHQCEISRSSKCIRKATRF